MSNELTLHNSNVPMEIGAAIPVLAGRFRVKGHVTRSVLRQEENSVFFITMQSEMKVAPELATSSEKKREMPSPVIADILNLETGEYQILICNTVLENEMNRNFPEGGYVGRSFAIAQSKGDMVDKRYRTYKILEIEANETGDTLVSSGNGVIDGTTSEAIAHVQSKRAKKHTESSDAAA